MYSWVCASTPTVTRTMHAVPTTPSRLADVRRALDLVEGVDDDPADAVRRAPRSISAIDLLLPCSRSARREARPASATASSPPVQTSRRSPSSRDPARDLGAEERLAGVVDVGAAAEVGEGLVEGRRNAARPSTEVVLVDDVGRRAELRGEVADVDAADRQRAVGAASTSTAHSGRHQRVDVLRRAQPGRAAVAARRAGRRPRARALHPLRGADAEQAQAVGQHHAGGVVEPQPGAVQVGDLLVAPGSTRQSSYHLWYAPARSSR